MENAQENKHGCIYCGTMAEDMLEITPFKPKPPVVPAAPVEGEAVSAAAASEAPAATAAAPAAQPAPAYKNLSWSPKFVKADETFHCCSEDCEKLATNFLKGYVRRNIWGVPLLIICAIFTLVGLFVLQNPLYTAFGIMGMGLSLALYPIPLKLLRRFGIKKTQLFCWITALVFLAISFFIH